MKYDITGPAVESSGVRDEGDFGIDQEDMGPILHLLRGKIYSNLPRAVVQEYLCNGRDAQRVKGNTDVPLRVTLPTIFEMSWKCRDFGDSIAPEDMKRVFIRYGKSTKRADNLQTGGFGIGCKTGFGYGDAFHVTTFRDGIARSYACILDESKCGKLLSLGERETTEPNGTEIIVPVKREDVARFRQETIRATEFWDVRPEIVGGELIWSNTEATATFRGTNWFIAPSAYGARPSSVILLVDGIEYAYPMEQLRRHIPFQLHSSCVFLRFGVGQIPVAANREQVEVDNKTQLLVSSRLEQVAAELPGLFKTEVDKAPSFIAAYKKLVSCCQTLGVAFPKDQTWNGMKFPVSQNRYGSDFELPGSYIVYSRGANNAARKDRWSQFPIEENVAYISTDRDFNNIVENGATAIFKAFPNYDKVCVVRWSNPADADDLFKGFGFRNLSEFYTPKDCKAAMGRLTFFKFNSSTRVFSRSSVAEFEADKNKKLWCKLAKVEVSRYNNGPSNGLVVLFGGKVPSESNSGISGLLSFVSDEETSLYGFAVTLPEDRVQAATEGLDSLESVVNTKIEEDGVNLGEVVYAATHCFDFDYLFLEKTEQKAVALRDTFSSTSLFAEYLEKSQRLSTKIVQLRKLAMLANFYKQKSVEPVPFGSEVLEARLEVVKRYPMLRYGSGNPAFLCGGGTPTHGLHRLGDEVSMEDLLAYVLLLDSTSQSC